MLPSVTIGPIGFVEWVERVDGGLKRGEVLMTERLTFGLYCISMERKLLLLLLLLLFLLLFLLLLLDLFLGGLLEIVLEIKLEITFL